MTDPEILFNINNQIPKIYINDKKTEYELNPYLYSYFKHIHNILTLPKVNDRTTTKTFKSLEELLCPNTDFQSDCLDATFEIDAILISNLINPTAGESLYVTKAKMLDILSKKEFHIKHARTNETFKIPEKPHAEKSEFATIAFTKNNFVGDAIIKDVQCVEPEKLQYLNSLLKTEIIGMRQVMVNRQAGLFNYYRKPAGDDNNPNLLHEQVIHSASGLQVTSFCVPHQIISENESPYRSMFPNVTWMEGIGLVSTTNICQNELLVVDQSVNLTDFVRLKMKNYETSIKYFNLDELPPREETKLSYDYEGRHVRQPKMCLYVKT